MKFLRRFRLHSKSKNSSSGPKYKRVDKVLQHHLPSPPLGLDYTARLPRPILRRIFASVCPHVLDDSYRSSEESMTENGCMLCDMRDLARCTLVCSRWMVEAEELLYRHIRIDPVHYCELEIELAAKRQRRTLDRNGEPIDVPKLRLILLLKTVRKSPELAEKVQSLRLPYMAREASKMELAQTISVLPNLRYVDLPSGVYSDEASSQTLKQELTVRCPKLRRMRYAQGSEATFSRIPTTRPWVNLEELELSGLQVENGTLRVAVASFPALRSLKLKDSPSLDDTIFEIVRGLPLFPPVQRLEFCNTPNVTANGLIAHLSIPHNRTELTHLSLSNTGVVPQSLCQILPGAPRLRTLAIIHDANHSFPTDSIPHLSSRSLRSLRYEITSESTSYGVCPASLSYYPYLISSLLSNSLPGLRTLYVRDASFPETLLLTPPPRLFGGGHGGPQYQNMGFRQPLSIYSKGMDELEWNLTKYEPLLGKSHDSITRPVSFHEAQLSSSWGGVSRESILVGNGFGGFLAIPADESRPGSSGGVRRGSKHDLWR